MVIIMRYNFGFIGTGAMGGALAEAVAKKFQENKFDMNDLLAQFKQIKKLGSIKSIISMLPGIGDKLKDVDIDDNQLQKIEAIITSMTLKERAKPEILNASRKKRIAAGCGQSVENVNRLLKQYEQMKKMFKQMNSKGSKKRMMRGMPGGMPGMPGGFRF